MLLLKKQTIWKNLKQLIMIYFFVFGAESKKIHFFLSIIQKILS